MVMVAVKCDDAAHGVKVIDAPCDKAAGPSQCGHNRWTKLAKKRGKLVLRCQVCNALWKTRPEEHQKCAAFHAGWCPLDALCPCPHIYARRERARPAHMHARMADSPNSSDGDSATSPSTEEAAANHEACQELGNDAQPGAAVSVVAISQNVLSVPAVAAVPVTQQAWRYDPYA